tara:strand:- start:3132 stop:3599 length:468 start_codon:yes stop_codon:yes gene_type:complete
MEKELVIRKIRFNDLKKIESLQRENSSEINNIWTLDEISSFVDKENGLAYLSETNQKLNGFILCLDNNELLDIFIIFVAPLFRRGGIAKKFMRICEQHCKSNSLEKISLEVNEQNYAAKKFYKKLNFKKVGLRKGYYFMNGKRQDAIIMQLDVRT